MPQRARILPRPRDARPAIVSTKSLRRRLRTRRPALARRPRRVGV